jgi:hypothetical protein
MNLPAISGTVDDDRLAYTYVQVQDLRSVWSELQYGLEVIRTTNHETWIAEDIYAGLLQRRLHLWVFRDQVGKLEGFGIYNVLNFDYDFVPCLNIHIGWSASPAQGWIGVELSKRIAKAAGLTRIVFSTPQDNAWVKRFKKITTYYEVE